VRVLPALVIPVVDVLAEDDGLRVELFEEAISRRATRAAFGGEEFDQDGGAGLGGSEGCRNQRYEQKPETDGSVHAAQKRGLEAVPGF